ncbi:hypothetical protein BB558_003764 [Smittium angustum]|uniref:t-SNARE coiled-coil homology domain-containing protein n=1 Tax=Smittium angustum TaxID=133377 RepID=A0A2U1J551_SMIAN|nr:hypothetical protein BB558_003764 [Smittium angustum]
MSNYPTKRQKPVDVPGGYNVRNPHTDRERNSQSGRYFADAEDDKYKPKHTNKLLGKVEMLKEVSISIGDEIREQNKFLQTMGEDLEHTELQLSARMKQFYEMAARQVVRDDDVVEDSGDGGLFGYPGDGDGG